MSATAQAVAWLSAEGFDWDRSDFGDRAFVAANGSHVADRHVDGAEDQ